MGCTFGTSVLEIQKNNSSSRKDRKYEIKNNNLGFFFAFIPAEVITELIFSYLTLSELYRFDSAITNHQHRKLWLEVFHRKISPTYHVEKVFDSSQMILKIIPISKNRIITTHMKQTDQHSEAWIIRVWDIQSNDCKELIGHTSTILEISEITENCLFSTSHDNTFRLWNIEFMKCEKIIENSVSFQPILYPPSIRYLQNDLILSRTAPSEYPCGSNELLLWNIFDETKRKILGNEFGSFIPLRDYQQDNIPRFLAQSIISKNVLIWNCQTYTYEKILSETNLIQDFLLFPCFSNELIDPRVLSYCTYPMITCKIWNLIKGECEMVINLPSLQIASIHISIFQLRSSIITADHRDLRDYAIAFGNMSMSSSNDVHVVHLSDQSMRSLPHPNGIKMALLSFIGLENGRVFTCTADKKVRIFNAITGDCERMIFGPSIRYLEVLSNGRLTSNYDDHHLVTWKPVVE